MCLETSKCVSKSNGFVYTLPCISNSFILSFNFLSVLFLAIIFLFLFLEIVIYLWQFVFHF